MCVGLYANWIEERGQYGLFTGQKWHQGATLIWLPAERILPEPDQFSLRLPDLNVHVDLSEHMARYLNHSCNPNCAVRGTRIVAWSCIAVGDELTIDYRKTENRISNPFTCSCGHCDGVKVG